MKIARKLTYLLILISTSLQASLVHEDGAISYYSISQNEAMPETLAKQARVMLYAAYDPKLHEGLTLEEMGLKDVNSYEEFLDQLLEADMTIYTKDPKARILFYACEGKQTEDYSNLAGFCSLLLQKEEGHYYLDHIGTRSQNQRSGIGSGFVKLLPLQVHDLVMLTLDTRVFNEVSKPFYAKHGFTLVQPHPLPHKEGRYLFYRKRF